jgi:hypothetical protein
LHDQVFEFLVDSGPSHGLALLRAIEFLSDQFTMPAQQGIGLDDGGDLELTSMKR